MIKFFDIFAGIGGFRSGLEKVGGFECVGYCECDKFAKQAYEALYDTRKELYFDDARKIDPEELPDIDLICGGFPCQSFSIAGKRRGFDDVRGTLFFEIARIAAVKRPRYLLMENVPGLLSHDQGRTFEIILQTLDELGYDVAWQVLNSADFGVPQARKRVFIIGFLRGECSGRVLSFTDANPKTLIKRIPGREGCRVYSPEGLSITLTGNAGGFGGRSGLYEILGLPIKSLTKTGYQIAVPGDSIDLAYADMNSRRGRVGHDIAHTVTPSATQGFYSVKCIDLNPEPAITELARCITARQNNGMSTHKGEKSAALLLEKPIPVLTPMKEKVRQQGRRFKDPDDPMFTITVTDRNGVMYNGLIRKLMPLECWRLQGFTDEQFSKVKAAGISNAQLYKQAGNAVTVNVIAALALFILEIDKEVNRNE
ncbi:DNA cytosine methyltransferase [Ruminococcus albus]|uniref:Cytosine-specific methyltransferase n=1 Tax=Ruminococcus albus (strain ATCC 27210 / DSM 20455 / JCM 14654 / NCDO 2250 / 7) TaxID=697329 RepID=E6UFJ6_RUMA7|nr:DNA cytosine methyltransferase [Ruminococcus albus]ADU21900.1 DNA-cytosine methyltransferase [Ruminococcus albus 7 = DSM 20455]